MIKENSSCTLLVINYCLKKIAKNKPIIFILYFIRFFAELVNLFCNLLFPKKILDEVTIIIKEANKEDFKYLVFYVSLLISINLLFELLNSFIRKRFSYYKEFFNRLTEKEMDVEMLSIPFVYLENNNFLNQYSKAKDGIGWYSGGIIGIIDFFYTIVWNIFSVFSVIFILLFNSPIILPILVLVLFVVTNLTSKKNTIEISYFSGLSKLNRLSSYFMEELGNPKYGKEIRFFNAESLFLEKINENINRIISAYRERTRKQLIYENISSTIVFCRDAFTYTYLGLRTIKGFYTVGDFTMLCNASLTFTNSITSLFQAIQQIKKRSKYFNEFLIFLDNIHKTPSFLTNADFNHNENILVPKYDIEFKNVSFTYPGTTRKVLDSINLKICSGEHLAIVGLNGAGKTTLIKLLCRLYEAEGEILLNGTNIRNYTTEEYSNILCSVFQDFYIYPFSLIENITLNSGKMSEIELNRIRELFNLLDISDLVNSLPNKENTILSKSFSEEGVLLSGGEQQKIALIRALYKKNPILILDEPTSAFDPISEFKLYQKFTDITKEKTTILVSHRMGICKLCDKIAVFSDGKILQYGTHDELIKEKSGLYASMYNEQAKYYT